MKRTNPSQTPTPPPSDDEGGPDVPPQVLEDESAHHKDVMDKVVKKQRPDFVRELENLKKKLKR
jgi:hypothetical protein